MWHSAVPRLNKRDPKPSHSVQTPSQPALGFFSLVNNFIGSLPRPDPIRLLSTRASASGFLSPQPLFSTTTTTTWQDWALRSRDQPGGHVSVPALSGDAIPPQDGGASASEPARPGASLPLSSVLAGPSVGRRGGGNQDPGLSKSGSPRKHQQPGACAPAPLPLPLQGQHHLWMLENFSPKKIICFFEEKKNLCHRISFSNLKKKKKIHQARFKPPQVSRGWDRRQGRSVFPICAICSCHKQLLSSLGGPGSAAPSGPGREPNP